MNKLLRWMSAFMLAGAVNAEVLVQWGERPSGAGTPGTNIVSVNQNFIGAGTTFTGTTNNPAVGANYYPSPADRSPYFSVAVSSTTNAGGRLVEQASNGDRLQLYGQSVPAAATYRGMVMWMSNYFLITDQAMTVTNAIVAISQRSNANTTDQGVRIIVRQSSSYFVTEAQSFGANYLTQTFALGTATWYEFTPFTSGSEVLGAPVSAPSLNNVEAIGYYFTARNGGGAAGACGAQATYFATEGFETPSGDTKLLTTSVNNPSWGAISPTGGLYSSGLSVVLTASPSNHYAFVEWSGSLGGTTNPVTIVMSEHKSISATFTAILATNSTPHWWLAQYGLPTSDAGALSDTDGDGLAAWQEYQAGSNPTMAPHVTALIMTNRTALQITFDSDLIASNAAVLSHYALNHQAYIYASSVSTNLRTVTLSTTFLPTGQVYTLSVAPLATVSGANVPATNILFSCAPNLDLQPENLIGDPGFDAERSTTALSNTFWRAINVSAGNSNGVELAGRQAWEVARFSATYSTYGGGDADTDPDIVRLKLDTYRSGAGGNVGTLIAQIRGVNGAAPTNDTQGTVIGSLSGNARFGSENFTYSFDTDNDSTWHVEDGQSFAVGADYDWYIVRLNVFPNDSGAGEPEYVATTMGADDVEFTIDGHVAADTAPPSKVTGLTYASTPTAVTLSWRNATESDTEGVLILRRAGAAPTAVPAEGIVYTAGQSLGDATVVCHAPGTNRAPFGTSAMTDTGIVNGVTYYYAVFACDEMPNYADGVVVQAEPPVTYWWDANGNSAGLGGAGNWDTASLRWRSALSTDPLTTWPNTIPNTDEAIFDGVAGVVTNTAGTLYANKITFRAHGFSITNGTVSLSGADPALLTAWPGVTGMIGSVMAGTNSAVFTGGGTFVLAGNNTMAGGTVISGATVQVMGLHPGPVQISSGSLIGSGQISGGITMSGGTLSPGSAVGTFSASSANFVRGTFRFDITNAAGTAGSGWDLLNIGSGAGSIDFSAATTGSVTLDVVCASASLPGFNPTQSSSWKIMDAGTLPGFAASIMTIRTASFIPAINEGVFAVTSNAGDLYLAFTPATPVDLHVRVSAASNPSDVGISQTYTIVISNAGPELVGTYYVTNALDSGTTYQSSSDGGAFSGGRIAWTLYNLAANASKTLTLSALNPVTQSIITNTVTVAGLRTDPFPANNTASVVIAVQCPGAPAPFLPTLPAQTVETGNLLTFYVVSSNADCAAPSFLLAGGLPSGSTFTVTTNDYELTGLFTWPFSGSPGTYPVRFYAANITSYTNTFTLLIHVASNGEPVNGDGVPLSQTNWHVEIVHAGPVSSGNITLAWSAVDGVAYDIFRSTGNFGEAGVTWSEVVNGLVSDSTQLVQAVGAPGSQCYYQVMPDGISPTDRGVWAVMRPVIPSGFSTFSAPVDGTDLRFDGDFGERLAEALSGNNVHGLGDEVYLLNANGSYSNLYLDASGTWRAAIGGAPVATHQLEPGQGFVILRRAGGAVQPEFSGPVGNQNIHTNTIRPGYNIIGLSEGKHLSLASAFASPVSGSPAGSYNQAQADSILILESNGSYTTLQRLPNGTWLDLTTFTTSTRRFVPGQAVWYYRNPGEATMKVRF